MPETWKSLYEDTSENHRPLTALEELISIAGAIYPATIDTGKNIAIISIKCAERLRRQGELWDSSFTLKNPPPGIARNDVQILNLRIHNYIFPFLCVQSEEFEAYPIIGRDIFKAFNLEMQCRSALREWRLVYAPIPTTVIYAKQPTRSDRILTDMGMHLSEFGISDEVIRIYIEPDEEIQALLDQSN